MKHITQVMHTTTLQIALPINCNRLAERFDLYRYEIPAAMSFPQNKSKYDQLHNQLKEQIDHPYKAFKYDMLDGVKKWVVYVLHPKNEAPKSIAIKFLSENPLECRQVRFEDLSTFNLIKLLQVCYFRQSGNGQFVGQDKCYIYAKREKNAGICLEIELKGDQAEDGATHYLIKVDEHARIFLLQKQPLTADKVKRYTYYASSSVKNKQMYFSQVKSSQVLSHSNPLYNIWRSKDRPATLDYHSQSDPEHTRGKILHDFISGFTAYLRNEFGIIAEPQKREFHWFEPSKKPEGLPLEKLGTVYLYDIRKNKAQYLLEAYQQLFASHTSTVRFEVCKAGETLPNDFPHKVLVIQDCDDAAFEAGIIEGEDPYKVLYQDCPSVLKKAFNVNPNDPRKTRTDNYLNYPMIGLYSKGIKEKITVTLNRLFLKGLMLRPSELQQGYNLPLTPVDYIFVRKGTYKGCSYEVMLRFQNNRLIFDDLSTPEGKQYRKELAADYGLDWSELYERMLDKNKPYRDRAAGEDLASYEVILSPGQFIEIEELGETILYRYDEIITRQKELARAFPVEGLKLARHYDKIRPDTMLSLAELQAKGFLSGQAQPGSSREVAALARYQQLLDYDEILDQQTTAFKPELSINDLSEGELLEQVAAVLTIIPDENGKFDKKLFNRKLRGYYQRLGMFRSPKEFNLHMYEGIWYTDDNCYVVGAADSLKDKQAKANLVRRFYLHADEISSFRIGDLLDAVSVKFIRLNQYTVLPYYFNLIQIYIREVLAGNPE